MTEEQKAFIERYAPMAMEQQVKYGIPASLTLAQMALESGWGKGRAITEGNNAFCIKSGGSNYWNQEGHYILISDDKKDEKFRKYDSLEQSFNDHSKVLMSNSYAHCHKLQSTDYTNWVKGLQSGKAHYATDPDYANKLLKTISANNLHQYDLQAVLLAKNQGVQIGYSRGNYDATSSATIHQEAQPQLSYSGNLYRLPVGDGTQITMTSAYGHRTAPTAGASSDHKGIDIQAKYEDVYSMERGKVVNVGSDKKSGKFVIIEYERADGKNYLASFCHLDSVNVAKGDAVDTNTIIARSGATGVGTGPHLHLTVKQKGDDNEYHHINPLDYLAELSVRGMSGKVVTIGKSEDLLADRKAGVNTTPTPQEILLAQNGGQLNDEQRKNLEAFNGLSNNKMGLLSLLTGGMNQGGMTQGGSLSSLVSGLFMAAIGVAVQMDMAQNQSVEETVEEEMKPASSVSSSNEEQKTLIKRERESIDGDKAHDMAMMNFDTECPEQSQGAGQRLA